MAFLKSLNKGLEEVLIPQNALAGLKANSGYETRRKDQINNPLSNIILDLLSIHQVQSCQVVFELFSILIPKNQYFAEEISIFPRGNNMTKKNTFLPHMPAADLAFFQGEHRPRAA